MATIRCQDCCELLDSTDYQCICGWKVPNSLRNAQSPASSSKPLETTMSAARKMLAAPPTSVAVEAPHIVSPRPLGPQYVRCRFCDRTYPASDAVKRRRASAGCPYCGTLRQSYVRIVASIIAGGLALAFLCMLWTQSEPPQSPSISPPQFQPPSVGSRSQDDQERASYSSEPTPTLAGHEDGYAWSRASVQLRISLCRDISERMRREHPDFQRVSPQDYYDAIDRFYASRRREVMRESIGTAAALMQFSAESAADESRHR